MFRRENGWKWMGVLALIALIGVPIYAWAAPNATLLWQDNSNNETGFRIEKQVDGGAFTVLTTTAANVTSFNDTALTAGHNYCYRVIAFNGFGDATTPAPNVMCADTNVPAGAVLISVLSAG